MEANGIGNRVKVLIQRLGMNNSSFSKAIGLNNSATIGNIINGKYQPSFEVLYKIMEAFPDISFYWLMSGRGDIYNRTARVENDVNKPKQPIKDTESESIIKTLRQENKELKENLDKLREQFFDINSRYMNLLEKVAKIDL